MAICIKRNNMSKSVSDLFVASETEKLMRGLTTNQSMEYVKTGFAVKNPCKTLVTVEGSLDKRDNDKVAIQLAKPIKSIKDIFNWLDTLSTPVEFMGTFNVKNCDPLNVVVMLDKQNRKIVLTQNMFCNVLKQLITRYTTLSDRKELGLDNRIDGFCLDAWFDCIVCYGGSNANKLLNELETRAWVNKSLNEG